MRKFFFWFFLIIITAGIVYAAITQTLEKQRKAEEYKRMLFISDLEREVDENIVVCRVAISDSENKGDSVILKNRIITNFVNLAEADFKFGSDASDRWTDIKNRLKLNGFLVTEKMETEVPGKNVADVYDIFVNIKWLLNKAKKNGNNFNF
jgi:hypothetical protein